MNQERKRHDPLAGLRVPTAPERLRPRVLAAARVRLQEQDAPGVWDRLWGSRPLRVAWAATTLGLALAHIALSVTPQAVTPAATTASRGGAEELRDELALPTVEISPRAAGIALGAPRSAPAPGPRETGNHEHEEVKS